MSSCIYPFFLLALEHSTDPITTRIISDMAFGIFPHGISFDGSTLKIKGTKGAKGAKGLELNKDNSNEMYMSIQDILSHVISKPDDIMIENWSSIKIKNLKDMMIQNYVTKIKKERNLSWTHARNLLSIINLGLVFKYISPKDIHMENGEISNIDGIDYESITLTEKIYVKKIKNHNDIQEPQFISNGWVKYMNNVNKIPVS